MEKMTEQELQDFLAKGIQPSDDSLNSKAYQMLFNELKNEPANGLPYNFSAKVTAKLRLQQDLKLSFKSYLITLLLIFARCLSCFLQYHYCPNNIPRAFYR
jgi:hypothetical protein